MYTRRLVCPSRSFLLFGPRGTGKTTWLRAALPSPAWVDLLDARELVRHARDPQSLSVMVTALPRGSWVVVDEIQRLPSLLDQVHALLSREPRKWRFALTGSSARKLRRADVNLLGGRVVTRNLFPLTSAELGHAIAVDDLLRFGGLPLVRTERSHAGRVDLLESYVDTYLTQEIRAEALVRSLDTFARFLGVAALANAQVTNVAAIARDAAIARPTVQGHFEVLTDTLLGTWLPAWRARAKVKEVAHPKFYFFDTGVVRALGGRLREAIAAEERGHLLETWIFHELRAHVAYAGIGGHLAYWRTPSGSEVDFVWSRAARAVAIEVKSRPTWRAADGHALNELLRAKVVRRAFAIYTGDRELRDGEIRVLPVHRFLEELGRGRVLS